LLFFYITDWSVIYSSACGRVKRGEAGFFLRKKVAESMLAKKESILYISASEGSG
jgi:hypothetical protein